MAERLCRLCGKRPVPPSRLARQDYRCSRCRAQTPAYQAYKRRRDATPRNRARAAERAKKRIYVGTKYHSMAATAEDARRINAHVKDRVNAFKQGLANGKEAEGAAAG